MNGTNLFWAMWYVLMMLLLGDIFLEDKEWNSKQD